MLLQPQLCIKWAGWFTRLQLLTEILKSPAENSCGFSHGVSIYTEIGGILDKKLLAIT